MAVRRSVPSTDQLGMGDNLFSGQKLGLPGGTAQGGQEDPGLGMPGTPNNPNTGVGGVPPTGPITPPIVSQTSPQPSWMNGNSQVNLTGWDPSRTDSDPKMEWGRYIQSLHPNGQGVTTDDLKSFVAQDPRWEMQGNDQLRVKQGELDKWKPGISIWQDAIGDVGGKGQASFSNIEGDPSKGYAAGGNATMPTLQAIASGGLSANSGQVGQAQMPASSPTPDPFNGGGQYFPNTGQWVPKNNPAAIAAAEAANAAAAPPEAASPGGPGPGASPAPGGGVTPGATPGAAPGDPATSSRTTLDEVIKGLLSGGMNKDVLNKRVDSANDALQAKRRSLVDSQQAQLAERGLTGDGAETSALGRLDENLGSEFGQNLTDIYSDESKQADTRMLTALTTQAGLSVADAQNLVDKFNAQTGRQNADTNRFTADANARNQEGTLALGNKNSDQDFALGKSGQEIQKLLGLSDIELRKFLGTMQNETTQQGQQLDWNKFLASFGLDREKFGFEAANDPTSAILQIIQTMFGGAGTAAGGHV